MKKIYSLLPAFAALMVLSMIGCTKVEIETVTPEPIDRCNQKGTVMTNDCGAFVLLENGTKIYSERGISFAEGTEVVVGFVNDATANSHTGGGCGNDYDQRTPSEQEVCMRQDGIGRARIFCMREDGDTDR